MGERNRVVTDTRTCARCGELIRPEGFGSDRTCAFGPDGVFRRENWQCPIVGRFRYLAFDAVEQTRPGGYWSGVGDPRPAFPDATEIRDNDERIVTLSLIETGVTSATRRLPEAVILRWYKERGRTDGILFLRHDGTATPPTLAELQHVNDELKRAFPAWVAAFEESRNG